METSSRSVLLLGGAGYVGQFILQALLAEGYGPLHVTHRPSRVPQGLPPAIQLHELDLAASADAIAALLSGLGPCEKDPQMAMAVNCPVPLLDALALEAPSVPLVHFSTDIVFEGVQDEVYEEASETKALNVYGQSKAAFDQILLGRTAPFSVILRPSNILGPKPPFPSASAGGTKFLQWLDSRLQLPEQTKLFNDELRNYSWVEDLVEIVMKLLRDFGKAQVPRLMHCGGPIAMTRVQVAECLAAAKGNPLEFQDQSGTSQSRIVPVARDEIDLGYTSPLSVVLRSSLVETYLGRPLRKVTDCIQASLSVI